MHAAGEDTVVLSRLSDEGYPKHSTCLTLRPIGAHNEGTRHCLLSSCHIIEDASRNPVVILLKPDEFFACLNMRSKILQVPSQHSLELSLTDSSHFGLFKQRRSYGTNAVAN